MRGDCSQTELPTRARPATGLSIFLTGILAKRGTLIALTMLIINGLQDWQVQEIIWLVSNSRLEEGVIF
jgi:hypothetical protein